METTERTAVARILDANANRAREALRVVEDHCRYALDDAFLSRELKGLRHGLTEALTTLPGNLLLAARDTVHDVGTQITTADEYQRHSAADVVRANWNRLREALRTLEEFGKTVSPALGRALEGLRYRCYTLERVIRLGVSARQQLEQARLYVLVTEAQCPLGLERTIREAAAGGATLFQLREKQLTDRQLLAKARDVRRWTREAGVLFIVNDRPDIAQLAEADGVHLGQDELPVPAARRLVGPEGLIGVSTHSIEQVRQAVLEGASYIGVGPTFPSGTKDFAEFPGLAFVQAAVAETGLPAFAIGGINAGTIGEVVAAGAKRVAVSQAVCQAPDPRAAAAELLRSLPP